MLASWYEAQGPADRVLQFGEMDAPEPGPGELRVRMTVSGVNPGDTKKRRGWLGFAMPFPRVVPHSDGAGVVDAVGDRVDPARLGQRVWVYGAQSYRPFGTAAQYTVVSGEQAVALPDGVSDDLGACLGVPGITAHRAVFGDGPVDGRAVLVHGVHGAVGSLAAQLAQWGGATVIATVRHGRDRAGAGPGAGLPEAWRTVSLDGEDPEAQILAYAPDGVDRIVEVALSDNADLDAAVAAQDAVIAAYASGTDRPGLPFWPMLFQNVTLRLLGSDDFPAAAKRAAARDLTAAAAAGALSVQVRRRFPLHDIALAHDSVDAGGRGRVLVTIPH